MEQGFMNYLQTYFEDEGMPYLGDALANSRKEVAIFDVTRDLKIALKPDLYQRLVDQSFYYSLPYFPLQQFAEQWVGRPLTALTVMDWGDIAKAGFTEFMKKYHPDKKLPDILAVIDKYIKQVRDPEKNT